MNKALLLPLLLLLHLVISTVQVHNSQDAAVPPPHQEVSVTEVDLICSHRRFLWQAEWKHWSTLLDLLRIHWLYFISFLNETCFFQPAATPGHCTEVTTPPASTHDQRKSLQVWSSLSLDSILSYSFQIRLYMINSLTWLFFHVAAHEFQELDETLSTRPDGLSEERSNRISHQIVDLILCVDVVQMSHSRMMLSEVDILVAAGVHNMETKVPAKGFYSVCHLSVTSWMLFSK